MTAHRVLSDGVTPPPSLDVVANREGSFAVEMMLAVDETADILSSREAVAAAAAVTILSPVVNALRWRQHARRLGRGPRIDEVAPGEIRVSWPDGTTMQCPATSQDLVESMDFRRSAGDALAPISEDRGIESVEIRPEAESQAVEAVVLYREDARDLDNPPADDELLYESVREVGLNPLKPSFEAGYKRWVSDGSSRFWVEMHDIRFLQAVESSAESFSAGDVLRCRVRDRQLRDSDGVLRMEHIVLEVLEHLRRPPPDPLPFEN